MADTRVLDILRQVEAGDLTPEQADGELAALGVAEAAAAAPAPAGRPRWQARSPRGVERAVARLERRRARAERRFLLAERRRERHLHRVGSRYTVDHLIRMRLHGITPDYVEEMREAGYGDLSPEELAELRIHGVSPDYAGEMRELLGGLPVDKLVELRIHGVTPDLVHDLHDSGVAEPSPEDLLRWRHSTRGSRFGDAVGTAVEAISPHVTQLVEAALAEARRHIYEALRVTPSAPEEWRSIDASAPERDTAEPQADA